MISFHFLPRLRNSINCYFVNKVTKICCFLLHIGAIIYSNSEYSDGDGPILYSYVSCNGYEDGLNDCEKNGYDDISCPRTRLIGLMCRDGE